MQTVQVMTGRQRQADVGGPCSLVRRYFTLATGPGSIVLWLDAAMPADLRVLWGTGFAPDDPCAVWYPHHQAARVEAARWTGKFTIPWGRTAG